MVFAFSNVAINHSERQTKETDLPVIRPPSSRLTLASKSATIKFTGLGVRNRIGPMLGSFGGFSLIRSRCIALFAGIGMLFQSSNTCVSR